MLLFLRTLIQWNTLPSSGVPDGQWIAVTSCEITDFVFFLFRVWLIACGLGHFFAATGGVSMGSFFAFTVTCNFCVTLL